MPRLPLLLADLVGLCLEVFAIAVPAFLLYGRVEPLPPLSPVLWLIALFSAGFALWRLLQLRRLADATEIDPAARLLSLPRRALWVRAALWSLCGAVAAAWLLTRRAQHPDLLATLWMFSLNPLLVAALHGLAYDRLLLGSPFLPIPDSPPPLPALSPSSASPLPAPPAASVPPDPPAAPDLPAAPAPGLPGLRSFGVRYVAELERATLVTVLMALLGTVAFILSIPFDLEQLQRAQRLLPGCLFVLLLIGYRYASVSCRPINRYLHAACRAQPVPRPLAVAAFRAAQALPYRLGGALVVAGLLAVVALVGLFIPLLDLFGERLLLTLGVSLSVNTAASLYAILWHRATLRPLLGYLQDRHGLRADEVPAPLSLTAKMVGAFGLIVLCACVLSLLWSFVQYKTLATLHIQRLARDRLNALVAALYRELPVRSPAGPWGAREVAALLPGLTARAGVDREGWVYYFPDGDGEAIVVGRPPGAPPPRPPVLPTRRGSGQLDLPPERLTGEYERLVMPGDGRAGRGRLGAVAVLYPNHLHPGFRAIQGAPLRGQVVALVFFFLVLLFVSGGVVVIAVADLSRPVRYLERRAAAMAEGDLLLPVAQTAIETDEVGRLTLALEEMRRALSEKLRSSTQLNLQLEAEVARRTQELSRRNEEVSAALQQLQRTRDEILRTEKLATMGRIAAGVTSEINNPVSVMATLPDPLAEELDELRRLSEGAPLQREQLRGSLAELRQMVEVLLRGAQRAKEIVRATRVYVRRADEQAGPFELNHAVDEVLQLFADLVRYGVVVERDYGEDVRVVGVRSDVGQLLSSWLARATPRLRDPHLLVESPRLWVRTRRLGSGVEVTIEDNGPALPIDELRGFRESVPERPGVRVRVENVDGESAEPRTRFTLHLD